MTKKLLAPGYEISGGGTSGIYPLSGYGLLAASADPLMMMGNLNIGQNFISIARVWIPAGVTITNLSVAVRVAGTIAGGAIGARFGLYDDTGAQVSTTADSTTLLATAGWRSAALPSPIAAQQTGRFVHVALLNRQFVNPNLAFPGVRDDVQVSWFNGSGTIPRGMYADSTTALPASLNPASYTKTTTIPLIGIS